VLLVASPHANYSKVLYLGLGSCRHVASPTATKLTFFRICRALLLVQLHVVSMHLFLPDPCLRISNCGGNINYSLLKSFPELGAHLR
jgi:hypothetical protein